MLSPGVKKRLLGDEALREELCSRQGFCFLLCEFDQHRPPCSADRILRLCIWQDCSQTATLQAGEEMNVVVPTGNFGNILAAFYAKQMGLPVGKLLCASNENKVLYDFFQTGVYDRNRALPC